MKHKPKYIIYLLIAILAMVALAGGVNTLSFFTATSATLINVFQTGTVIIDAGDYQGELVIIDENPGEQCKDIELTISNNGSKYAYVRAAFDGYWRAAYHENTATVTAEYAVNGETDTLSSSDSACFIDGSYTGSAEWPVYGNFNPSSWFTAKDSTSPLLVYPLFPLYTESESPVLSGISGADYGWFSFLSQALNLDSGGIELQYTPLGNGSSGPPTVNGLFYGDGDYERYTFVGMSQMGSRIYYYLHETDDERFILYGIYVSHRSVNDNVFDNVRGPGQPPANTDYMRSADWTDASWEGKARNFFHLTNSEFITFRLLTSCDNPDDDDSGWWWQQFYVDDNRLDPDATNWEPAGNLYEEPPGLLLLNDRPLPDYIAATSIVWNMNNSPWANEGDIVRPGGVWKSPFHPDHPNDITYVDGYPAEGQITFSETYQWEWAMVYEFSFDVTEAFEGCHKENTTISLFTGNSHHSPPKGDYQDEDEFFYALDFGDLPDIYTTTLGDYDPIDPEDHDFGGARHQIVINGAYLGSVPPDPELDGQPHPGALGDDLNDLDDEDGIIFLTPLVPGKHAIIQVIAGTPGYLSAWIDFNSDGTLTQLDLISATGPAYVEPGLVGDLHLPEAGVYEFKILVPEDATGVMYSRWRYTNQPNQGGNQTFGYASTGEVEDHALASIGDYVWLDENEDGIQDDGEPGVEGVVVRLLDGAGNPVLDGDGDPITTVTDENGYYEFPGVVPGVEYRVEFVAPDGYAFTLQNQGSDDALDSDADPLTGITAVYILQPGENNTSIDAGLIMAPPGIMLKKYVSVDGGDTWLDAGAMPGPVLPVDFEPLFKFEVTNTGGIELTIMELSDDKFGLIYELNGGAPIVLQPGESYSFYYPPGDDWGDVSWEEKLIVATGELSVDFCSGNGSNEDWVLYDGYFYYIKPLAPGESVKLCVTVCPVDVDPFYEDFVYMALKAYVDGVQATHGAVYELWFEDEDPLPIEFEPKPE